MGKPDREFVCVIDQTLPGTDWIIYYKGDRLTPDQVEMLASRGVDIHRLSVIAPMKSYPQDNTLYNARLKWLQDTHYGFNKPRGPRS